MHKLKLVGHPGQPEAQNHPTHARMVKIGISAWHRETPRGGEDVKPERILWVLSISCYFILLLHYILKANVLLLHHIYLTAELSAAQKVAEIRRTFTRWNNPVIKYMYFSSNKTGYLLVAWVFCRPITEVRALNTSFHHWYPQVRVWLYIREHFWQDIYLVDQGVYFSYVRVHHPA